MRRCPDPRLFPALRHAALLSSLLLLLAVACDRCPLCRLFPERREAQAEAAAADSLSELVNPLVGTGIRFDFPGNCFPAVCPPFATTQWSAETVRRGEHPYYYAPYAHESDPALEGFVGSRFPSGSCMSDYGSVALMPVAGALTVSRELRASPFSREREELHPYSYAVELERYRVRVELTATGRCGLFRFRFDSPQEAMVLVDARSRGSESRGRREDTSGESWVRIDPQAREIEGYNSFRFRGYFVVRFDREMALHGVWEADSLAPQGSEARGTEGPLGAWADFGAGPLTVEARVGTSFISLEQARENLRLEAGEQSFEQVREDARQAWERALGKVRLTGADPERLRVFYTALWHCLLLPREFSEHGRYLSPFDGKVHAGVSYNDFSLWDTFRAEHPLLTILEPTRTGEMIQGLLAIYREGGWLPKWPNPRYTSVMIGTHADAVIADAYVKGIRNFDAELAWEAVRQDAMVPSPDPDYYEARGGLSLYMKYGFLPADSIEEGTSSNMEFSYGDFCVAQLAEALGKTEEAKIFRRRSLNYRNSFDPAFGFVRGRNADSSWVTPFDSTANGDRYFTEGTAWQYSWYVPHDAAGLIGLMGGPEHFCAKLGLFFTQALTRDLARWNPYYNHANEPSQHAAYLFCHAGRPWLTQLWVRKILAPGYLYDDTPGGLPENDDCGQMSAWYVLSALGFYPVCPGDPRYVLGSPIFPEAELRLENGKVFRVVARNVSEENIYIQAARLNGEQYDKSWLAHADLLNGGTLELEMGPQPNLNWASGPEAAPPSVSGGK